jgi:hypothetical protein
MTIIKKEWREYYTKHQCGGLHYSLEGLQTAYEAKETVNHLQIQALDQLRRPHS